MSIIADYDLNKAICELVDNAVDIWIKKGKSNPVEINLLLNEEQQTIQVVDNCGGIKKSDFALVIAPGHTSNDVDLETIGLFGVGTKRAVIALAQFVSIKTGNDSKTSYQVEFDDEWLKNQDDWNLPIFEIDEILKSKTVIELYKLRVVLTKEKISQLRTHLGCTYSQFLKNNSAQIYLNGEAIKSISFDKWAYPPQYEPREYSGILGTTSGFTVRVTAFAGLTTESSGSEGDYGVFFYCNDRLIVKGLKTFEVGFASGIAGKPHPNLSLARIIVYLNGPAKLMPWNSSKSGINTDHEVFIALQNWLVHVVKDFTSLSRRFQGHWPSAVFRYPEGKIVKIEINDFPKAKTSYLPPLPASKPRYGEIIKKKNQKVVTDKPWTKGVYETIIAVDLISKQKLDQKNRIILLLLDSNLEIAFKEYLVHESSMMYNDASLLKLFSNRHLVHAEIQKTVSLSQKVWKKINYYYKVRCELIHKRASVNISDEEIEDFRSIVEDVSKILFKLKF